MFFAPPPFAGRIPPLSPTGGVLTEHVTYCGLSIVTPAENLGPGLVGIVERSTDGDSWSEVTQFTITATLAGVNVMEAADADDPIYYRIWLSRYGVLSESARSYTRNAVPPTVTISITVDPSGSGTTTGAGTYTSGDTVSVSATPGSGYQFDGWLVINSYVSHDNPYIFTAMSNRALRAKFVPTPPPPADPWVISASVSPSGYGLITGAGEYEDGETVNLVATPASGRRFVRWTEGGVQVSTNANYSFTASADRTLVAVFEMIPTMYTISVSVSSSTRGTATGGGVYETGQPVTVRATAKPGYHFTEWTEGGVRVSTNADYSFTASANRTLVAQFGIGD